MNVPSTASARRTGSPVRLLPETLVDQIAAGEVVERPASVVKELVENAVDAGARRVRVEVRDGGRALIAVIDDGVGMTPEDARLALARHATSKIHSAADLTRIASFGFRGEALPAIGSVSRLRLRTRTPGAGEAFSLRVEGGRVAEARSDAGPEGTRVEVTELFANVPARRKFLKSATTEWGHVADWLGRAALALPAVHFDVQRDDRPALAWPSVANPLERVAAVLSEREAAALVPVLREGPALRIHGFVSRPDVHRAGAGGIYLFVNGRPVRDRLLRHALLDAYRDVLPRGRFPTAVLFLEIAPERVDVNVHPAKWEVRFAEPGPVHEAVSTAVRQAMTARRWIATPAETGPPRAAAVPSGPLAGRSDWLFAAGGSAAEAVRDAPMGPAATAAVSAHDAPQTPLRFAELRLLGQVLTTYLVLEAPSGLVLVDQHAAHERVLFERLRAGWIAGGVERQPLLLAQTLELAPAEVARLSEAASTLERFGFDAEPFGENAVALRAVPALLAERDAAGALRALLEALAGEGAPTRVEAADALFARIACHAARRQGDRLAVREQQSLLAELDAIPWSPTCPHGRPVAIPIGVGELERRFARR